MQVAFLEGSAKPQRVSVNKKTDKVAIILTSEDENFFVSNIQLNFDLMGVYNAY